MPTETWSACSELDLRDSTRREHEAQRDDEAERDADEPGRPCRRVDWSERLAVVAVLVVSVPELVWLLAVGLGPLLAHRVDLLRPRILARQ